MIKTWIGVLGVLSLPTLGLAQANEAQFRQLALLVVEQRLEQSEKAMFSGVLNQLCQETHLPDTEARSRLLALLDSLEAQRRTKGPGWKALLALAKQQGPAKGAEKLLRHLSENTRKALLAPPDRKGSDFDLKTLVIDAEANAQLQPGQGAAMLLQMLSLGSASTVPRLAGVPQQLSLLVEVQNAPLEVASTAEPPVITSGAQAKLPDLSPLLLAALNEELPHSGRITTVALEPDRQPQPDYRLVVTLTGLADSYNGGPMQEITLDAQLALVSMKSELQVLQRPLIVKRYTSTGKVLDPLSPEFCAEAAGSIRRALDAYLAAR